MRIVRNTQTEAASVPEPGTWTLMGAGVFELMALRPKRR